MNMRIYQNCMDKNNNEAKFFLQVANQIYLFSCINIIIIFCKLNDKVINYFVLKGLIWINKLKIKIIYIKKIISYGKCGFATGWKRVRR